MKITVLCVGKLKEKYWRDAVGEYAKRLARYCKLEIIEVAEEKAPEALSAVEESLIKQKEAAHLLEKIGPRSFVVALDLKGSSLNSQAFAEFLGKRMAQGISAFVFVIGGSLGLGEELLARADYRLCASDMTFPHQLMRVILLEQIYRSFRIMKNEPYHK